MYNCKPLSLLGYRDNINKLSPQTIRLNFTIESQDEVKNIAILIHFYIIRISLIKQIPLGDILKEEFCRVIWRLKNEYIFNYCDKIPFYFTYVFLCMGML